MPLCTRVYGLADSPRSHKRKHEVPLWFAPKLKSGLKVLLGVLGGGFGDGFGVFHSAA